ncbi:MAG: acyltransferase [Candidatus Hydrogenedentes bacterium]|nr:acyltransferase [Candidatus Hydrogenedentota bacterium]
MKQCNDTSADPTPTGRFQALNAFRGLAILWIVCFHMLAAHRELYGQTINLILKYGNIALSMFFVISGFGISNSVHKTFAKRTPLAQFIKKRMYRIYLPYWASLVWAALIIPVVSGLLSAIEHHSFNFEFYHLTPLEWVQMATLTKVFTAGGWQLNLAFLPVNGAVWFIAVIVQMYLVVACAMAFRTQYNKIIIAVSCLAALCLIPSVKARIPYGLFLPYWLDFATGILLFHVIRARRTIPRTTAPWLIGILLFLTITALWASLMFTRVLVAPFAAFLFYIIYPFDDIFSKTAPFRFFSFLGTFSYSLYLMHIPLWPLIATFVRHICPIPPPIADPLLLVPATVAASFIWYLFFEKPGSITGTIHALSNPLETTRIRTLKNTLFD